MTESSPPPAATVGIDIGALTTKVTLAWGENNELVRNSQGGHTTPTAVTFAGKNRARLLGETAAEISRADGNTASMLDRLLPASVAGSSDNDDDPFSAFRRFKLVIDDEQQQLKVYIPNMDEEYSTTALVAMLLGCIKTNVIATISRLNAGSDDDSNSANNNLHFVFAVPPSYPQTTRNALMDAAFAASVPSCSVIDSSQCVAAVYERKFGDNVEGKENKAVLVVEMGHARSCITILKKNAPNDTTEMDDGEGPTAESKVEVLSTVSSPTLGAGLIDIALFHHFLKNHSALSHHSPETFKTDSRPAQRLLEGCKKLKHLLSMLPENKVTVEHIGKNDTDVNLSCTRELLMQLCQKSVIERLQGMIEGAVEKAGGKDVLGEIEAIEITGGGTRIPMVQEAIRSVMGKDEDFVLSRSLDDTSLAFGASLIGIASSSEGNDTEMMDAEREARRSQLLKAEMAMCERDVQLLRKDELRNHIEAYILELRSARHEKHGSLLPTSEEFTSFLDGTDDWLFSDECDEATVQQMDDKWNSVFGLAREMCADYFAAKQAEAEQKDREMEMEAQLAAAEREAEAGMDGEEDDHDTRRLPFSRRLEIVMKNKKEGSELFSDGNYRHAGARYSKALTHCAKFFDLSPEQEQEVKDLKLSLHLNLALAYIKLEKYDQAENSCNDALKLDEANVKALYRRATVLYQKKKFDDATRDLKEAEKLAPDDKAVKKLAKLVDQQIAKQKKKEKAMAKKMFG